MKDYCCLTSYSAVFHNYCFCNEEGNQKTNTSCDVVSDVYCVLNTGQESCWWWWCVQYTDSSPFPPEFTDFVYLFKKKLGWQKLLWLK